MIVENKPGAGGTIGADFVAKSPPDGYTLLLADVVGGDDLSVAVSQPAVRGEGSDPGRQRRDVRPDPDRARQLASSTRSPKSIAAEKATPGKLNMASPGSGSSNHLTLENFNAAAGTKIVHIPYKGAGPAITDLVGGQVDLTLASGAASKPLLDGGKVKALAVTSRQAQSACCRKCRRSPKRGSSASSRSRGRACSCRPARRATS